MEKLGDLKLSGMGKMNGGRFNRIEIEGMGKIFGDVQAESAKITGNARIGGNANIGDLWAEGNCSIEGVLESGILKNSGNLKIEGSIKAGNINNNGRLFSRGSIKSENVVSDGYIKVEGNMEAEEFSAHGAFKINGLLNANSIDVKVRWASFAREVGGERIYIRHSQWNAINNLLLSVIGKENIFETELVEGTEILLENTRAKTVRGDKIIIGPKCEIDLIEYSGTLQIDPDSKVRNQVKIS